MTGLQELQRELDERVLRVLESSGDDDLSVPLYPLYLDDLTIDVLHEYADTLCQSLVGQGFNASYDRGWSNTGGGREVYSMLDGYGSYVGWQVWGDCTINIAAEGIFYLQLHVGRPLYLFISTHSTIQSLPVYLPLGRLVDTLRSTLQLAVSYEQCSKCCYCNDGALYCGLGRHMVARCNEYEEGINNYE